MSAGLWSRMPPTFAVPIARALASDLTALLAARGIAGFGTVGVPVGVGPGGRGRGSRRGSGSSQCTSLARWNLRCRSKRGGLVMCGGRLRSLTFRRCGFEDNAKVVLRHIAGTSLEICEQTHGSFEIFAAAIRGLAVTKQLDESRTGQRKATGQHRSVRRSPREGDQYLARRRPGRQDRVHRLQHLAVDQRLHADAGRRPRLCVLWPHQHRRSR